MPDNVDPYRNYNFKVEIGGITEGHFTECSRLGASVTPIQYREAGNNQVVRHIPGRVDYGEVTLSYGLTSSNQLWEWMLSTVQGRVERKNISIVLFDNEGTNEVMRWNLLEAWPTKWQSAGFNALSHEIAIENLSLVFDALERG